MTDVTTSRDSRAWDAEQAAQRSVTRTVRDGIALLMPGEALAMVSLFVLIVVVGIFEAAIVAMVIPLVQSIIDPDFLTRTAPFSRMAEYFGFTWSSDSFGWLAVTMSVIIVASSAGNLLITYLGDRQAAASRNRLGDRLLTRLIDAPYLWFSGRNSAILARQIFADISVWRQDFLQSMLLICQSVVMIALPSAVAVSMAPMNGLAAVAAISAIGIGSMLLIRPYVHRLATHQKRNKDATLKMLIQIMSGVREVKISNRSGFFVDRFNTLHATGNDLLVKQRFLSQISPTMILICGQLGFLAAAFVLWSSGISGSEVASSLAMIAVVVSRVVPATNKAANQFNRLASSIPFVQGLLALFDEIAAAERDFGRRNGGQAVPDEWNRIRFDDVRLRYPEGQSDSLRGLSLELVRGRRYGVVGRSGAGKSTFVNLLLGLIQPTSGQITVDGQDLAETDLAEWHEQIGYVPQDIFLVDDDLRANIAFGEPTARSDDPRIETAIERAHLDAVVSGLPDGLATSIGEHGRRLSGGQAQRVAIARAFYREPRIVLLDEATSALDSMTEADIQRSFDALGEGVLGIAVAHRVNSLRNCDEIIVMEHGRVQDMGSFANLLERNALFRELAAHPAVRAEAGAA